MAKLPPHPPRARLLLRLLPIPGRPQPPPHIHSRRSGWRTDSRPSYLLTLSCARLRLRLLPIPGRPSPASPLLPEANRLGPVSSAKLSSAALLGFDVAIGYLLMLAIMSFNGGVFVAGLTVGYWTLRCGDEDIPAVENQRACACA